VTSNSGANAIEVNALTKNFGAVRALDGLDLTVAEGEVHGFLGPNGAGKSTTIRILLGLVRADGGTARLLGGDPWADAVPLHRDIAYVPGDVTLWPSLTGGETIDLLARMRGGIDEKRRAELIERFSLDPTKKARTYSKGNRQKVSLVSAFSSNARLLLLDEPSSGLDPLMENVFQQCVGEARDRGATVLLSSHILAETEALCERVTIIRAGKTIESGTLDSMRHLSRTSIKAELIGDPGDLSRIKGVADVSFEGHTLRAQVDGDSLAQVVKALGDAGVRALVSQPPTLEELFLRYYDTGAVEARKGVPA
jgi:ABC-2 type transport system ATP-binding protein